MELWCGTPKGLKHMAEAKPHLEAEAKPHLEEAGKATDKVHDVRAEY
jgi:hypothetical protein